MDDPRCPATKAWVRDHTCKKPLGHHGMHECECGEHWLNEDDWTPCRSQGWAVLGMVRRPALVRCGLQIEHPGPHRFALEWEGGFDPLDDDPLLLWGPPSDDTLPCLGCGGSGQGRPQDDYCLRCGGSGVLVPLEVDDG